MEKLAEQQLDNGIHLTYWDDSKITAGDRWMIRLKCVAAMPLEDWMLHTLDSGSPEDAFVTDNLGGSLVQEIVMERIFVAEKEKEAVLVELQQRVKENILSYLGKEDFVQKLFLKKSAALRDTFLLQRAVLAEDPCDADESGPADFSACFQD